MSLLPKQAEIHAYHGWGVDYTFWNLIKQHIHPKIIFKTANRGYFGSPFYPKFDKNTKIRIVFVHSFGLHWCNTAVLSKADYMVIFNGFESFKNINKKFEELIYNVDNSLDKNIPENILEQFYQIVGVPKYLSDKKVNYGLLKEDLSKIKEVYFPIIDLDFGSTIIALESSKDTLLKTNIAGNMLDWYVGRKYIHQIEDISHALPYNKSQESIEYLSSVIPIFKHYENNK